MIAITGATGFLGQSVTQQIRKLYGGFIQTDGRKTIDLRVPDRLLPAFPLLKGAIVVHLAYPGADGIGTSVATPADLAHDTLQIDLNVIDACATAGVQKIICMGSVCGYPEGVSFPTGEDQLWMGAPEAVNAPYGHAKRMQLALLEAYRRQYGMQYTQLILSNLYGPGDRSGHVIPATIRKVRQALTEQQSTISVWGDGSASREFLYVEDAADAVRLAVERPALNRAVNICSGEEIKIAALVHGVCLHLGYEGAIRWDPTQPNGQPRRRFSNRLAQDLLGWSPATPFSTGLAQTLKESA